MAPGSGGLDEHLKTPGHTDLFGQSDAIVKHVLEVRRLFFLTAMYSVHGYKELRPWSKLVGMLPPYRQLSWTKLSLQIQSAILRNY